LDFLNFNHHFFINIEKLTGIINFEMIIDQINIEYRVDGINHLSSNIVSTTMLVLNFADNHIHNNIAFLLPNLDLAEK
jgi:hypothetical protein